VQQALNRRIRHIVGQGSRFIRSLAPGLGIVQELQVGHDGGAARNLFRPPAIKLIGGSDTPSRTVTVTNPSPRRVTPYHARRPAARGPMDFPNLVLLIVLTVAVLGLIVMAVNFLR
jgi:hypothetical protein